MEFLTNHSRINRKNMFLFKIKMMAIFLFALSLFNQVNKIYICSKDMHVQIYEIKYLHKYTYMYE